MTDLMRDELGAPKVVDRSTFQAELDALRVREKAHTREGDAIAAARRRLSMVEVDGATPLIGERGVVTLLDAFEGRRMLIAYYFTPEGRVFRRVGNRQALKPRGSRHNASMTGECPHSHCLALAGCRSSVPTQHPPTKPSQQE